MPFFHGQDVPVVVVFKAMGIECEQEIVQMVGCEEEVISTFAPSLEECHKLSIYTQLQVLPVFGNKINKIQWEQRSSFHENSHNYMHTLFGVL